MLKQKWEALGQQEQRTLMIAAPIVLAMLIWLLIVNPTMSKHTQLAQQLEKKQSDYVWMQQVSGQIKGKTPSQRSSLSGSLRQQATSILSRYKITPTRIQSGSTDKVSLFFDLVSFNQLMAALTDAEKNSLVIDGLQLNRTDKTGFVSGRLTITSG